MATSDDMIGLIFVHGFMSSPKAWKDFVDLIDNDPELNFVTPLLFRYSTPRAQIRPLRKVPTYDSISGMLAGFIDVEASDFPHLVLVTHSQGGLIVQRYLHRTLSDAQGHRLGRIRQIVMFSCPNTGSQLALSLRRSGLLGWNPQEPELRPLNAAVSRAHQTVINRVVHAKEAGAGSWPIPIASYAGEVDGIVTEASAHSVFPDWGVLPGDHKTIIRPKTTADSSYRHLKTKLLALREHTSSATPGRAGAPPDKNVGPPAGAVSQDKHPSLSSWERYALVEPDQLIHVDKVIDDVATAIEDTGATGRSAVAVWGEGGLGKTAITYAAVQRVAAHSGFTHVVWASARNTRFSAANASEVSVNSIYWHDLLRIIARQLDCPLPAPQALWADELRTHIETRLRDARLLLVVDNLEVVHAADEVIEQLRALGLRRPHRIVATTRRQASEDELDVRNIRITPLGEQESYNLVRLAARDGNSELAGARDEELRSVFDITEGNPFLIKLIARRYAVSGLPLPQIIDELRRVTGDLGKKVRLWLFEKSLEELAERSARQDARRLIFSFCANGRGGSMTYEELLEESVDPVDSDRFNALLTAACRLGLVRASGRDRRYSIHSLLYEHTCPVAQLRQA
ncbi:NB-ARC domain-containing protein [Streptomyces sp. NPDC048281]|uniref:alpha/beta fold hydrolase n=1 Tax=Streptomyces sp. NPDC048281 TaxID=3154715 RepID=UPI00342E9ECF